MLLDFDRSARDFWDQIPVRLRVANVELLATRHEDGTYEYSLPLLVCPFAAFGLACLRVARKSGRAALELDDYANQLRFIMTGSEVTIDSTRVGSAVCIPYDALFGAWKGFASTVREIVSDRHPNRPYQWWSLLTDDPPHDVTKSVTRDYLFEG